MIESQKLPVFACVVMAEPAVNKNISLNSFVSEVSSDVQ